MPGSTRESVRNLRQDGGTGDDPIDAGAPLDGGSSGARPAGRHSLSRHRSHDAQEDHPGSRRVLFVATSLGAGGIERHSAELASRLMDCGQDIAFVCARDSFLADQCHAKDIRTELIAARNSGDIGAAMRLANLIGDFDADIVHVHSRRDFVPTSLAVLLARKRRLIGRSPRLIIHSHLDKPLGSPRHLARRLFASAADTVVAVSEAVKARLVSRHGFAPSFIRLVYNGVDASAFLTAGSRAALHHRQTARKEMGIPAEAVVIGTVGRLDAKGQADLLASAAPLLRRQRSLWIVLVGPEGRSGDMERLRRQAETEGILPRVVMTGARDDVPAVLPAFDVLAHLPKSESFGLALVEAMASGLPTIATNAGGCGEVVVHNSTGLIVPQGDNGSLHTALIRLLIGDNAAEMRKRMGQEGLKIVCARFSVEQQIQRLMSLYDELAPGRK